MRKPTVKSLAIAVIPCIAVAGQLPPPAHPDVFRGQVASLKQPIAWLTMGPLRVQLEETPLSRVRDLVKSGSIAHQGDGGESLHWLCYTAGTGVSTQRVWIVSNEMGGGRVNSVQAERAPDAAPTASCPQLPAKFLPLNLDHGGWIGEASHATVGWTTYGYAGKRGKFDVTSELAVQTSGGKVVSLSASRITSD